MAKAKETKEHAGTAVRVVTTVEVARMTSRAAPGHTVGSCRNYRAARQAKMQAKDGTPARAIGNT